MAEISENDKLQCVPIDPELDRLYREHAIASAISVPPHQVPIVRDDEIEPIDLESISECSSTFGEFK